MSTATEEWIPGKLWIEIRRGEPDPEFADPADPTRWRGPYQLTARLPDGRSVVAEMGATPDGILYRIQTKDEDSEVVFTFWGRDPRDDWTEGQIPPWERFSYRVPVVVTNIPLFGMQQRYGAAELVSHEIVTETGLTPEPSDDYSWRLDQDGMVR